MAIACGLAKIKSHPVTPNNSFKPNPLRMSTYFMRWIGELERTPRFPFQPSFLLTLSYSRLAYRTSTGTSEHRISALSPVRNTAALAISAVASWRALGDLRP